MLVAGCDAFMDPGERVARARTLIAGGDHRAAVIQLKNALQDDPRNVEGRLLLAQASLHLGDAADAETELRRAIEAGAEPRTTADLAARIALALGKYQNLLIQIDAGELTVAEPALSIYRGRALLRLGQTEQAKEVFESVLVREPQSSEARIGLSEALFAQGEADAAFEQLNAEIAASGSVMARMVKGTILTKRGEFSEARTALEEAHAQSAALPVNDRVTLIYALAESQLAQGDLEAAAAARSELAGLTSTDAPLARMLAARIAIAKQDYAAAATELQRVVVRAPGFVPARFLLGAALLAQGNLNQAEVHLSDAVKRAPENLEARKLLAQARLRLQRPQDAIEVLLPVQQREVEDSQLEALLGLAHLQLGDPTAGIAQLERSLAQGGGTRELRLDLAVAYAQTGLFDKALAMAQSVPRLAGDVRREQLLLAIQTAAKGFGAAQAEVKRLVAENPRDTDVLNLAAIFLAQQREFDGARALLVRALEAKPGDTATLMNRSRVEIAAGSPLAAAEPLNAILERDPANVAARLLRVELALRSGDADEAIALLEKMRADDAQAIEPRLRLIRVYLQQKQRERSDAVIKETLALAAKNPEALTSLGRLLLEAGRYEEALSQFRAVTSLAGDNAGYWLNVARAQLALDHAPAARESLQKALAVQPQWLPAVAALSFLDVRENKPELARARFAEFKKARPKEPAVLTLEGDLMMAMRDYPRAADAFGEALQLRPTSALAIKAYRARQLGKLSDAIAPLEAWLRQQPDDSAARAALAEAYHIAGQHRRAIEQYELIVRAEPDGAFFLNNLAWLYHEIGDERAEATAEKAYRAAPDAPAIADTYGWILVQRSKVEQGLEILERAVSGAPDNRDIRFHYAVALAKSGAARQAREQLRRLLEADGEFAGKAQAKQMFEQLSAR